MTQMILTGFEVAAWESSNLDDAGMIEHLHIKPKCLTTIQN
jgi:hypothetical protein